MPDDGSFSNDSDSFAESTPEQRFSEDVGGAGRRGRQSNSGGVAARIFRLFANAARDLLDGVRQKAKELLESPDGFARGLRVVVAGTLAIAFLIVIMLLIFYRPTSPSAQSMGASAAGSGTSSAGPISPEVAPSGAAGRSTALAGSPGGTVLSWISSPIEPSDFLVPRSDREALEGGVTWRLSRLPHKTWSQKEINRFWIDPTALVVEHLSKRNGDLIDEVFRGVP